MNRNYFYELLGFRFIANHTSKEIHRVSAVKKSCGIGFITNGRYCTGIWAKFLINYFGYNGCCHCFKNKDTDKKHY